RMLTIEGILGIQAGDNPRVLSDKLMTFVPPDQREAKVAAPPKDDTESDSAPQAADERAAA
ncbi:MAG: hypothetical protein QOE11_2410, partial [Solirubrobacteraceae bacterium]|nr:hypothetical protein [Solirubrobacteraceae bacterium]